MKQKKGLISLIRKKCRQSDFRVVCMLIGIAAVGSLCVGCGGNVADSENQVVENVDSNNVTGQMELKYASEFSVEYFEDGCAHVSVADGNEYIVVPEKNSELAGKESAAESEPTEGKESAVESEPAEGKESAVESEPAEGKESAAESEPTEGKEFAAESEPAEGKESAAESEPAEGKESAAESEPMEGKIGMSGHTNHGYENATMILQPCNAIYQAASSGMDLVRELGGLGDIACCSTDAKDYAIEDIKELIGSGEIQYVGKYSAPDFEMLKGCGTDLAIESTMIYHDPKIKEQIEGLGIPVFVDYSSYEKEPLGRLEWIKLYGLLLGKEEEAEAFFDEQVEKVCEALPGAADMEASDIEANEEAPTVVFFYVSSNGYVNVRKPGDYISKMIEMAGGRYALASLEVSEENALSTVNVSREDFYAYAKDADVLIYNSTVDGGIDTVDELVDKDEMFADFAAVREGRVYCTTQNMYQETSKIGEMILELKSVVDGGDGIEFIYRLS